MRFQKFVDRRLDELIVKFDSSWVLKDHLSVHTFFKTCHQYGARDLVTFHWVLDSFKTGDVRQCIFGYCLYTLKSVGGQYPLPKAC